MNSSTGLHLLIRRIAHGDKIAQAELYELTCKPFTQYVTGHFGPNFSEEDITEIVHQSILTLILHAKSYRGSNGNSSAWGWAYRIARNQALKWLKSTRREIRFPEAGDENVDAGDTQTQRTILHFNPNLDTGTVEEQVLEKMFREKAIEIIRQLNRRERVILYLHYEKGWTFRQIAEHMKVKPARITQIVQNIQRKCQAAMVESF